MCVFICLFHVLFFSDAARFRSVLFIVLPILILMITLSIVYRYKCHKVTSKFSQFKCMHWNYTNTNKLCNHFLCCVFPGAGVNMDRNKTKSAEEVTPSVCECVSVVSFQKMMSSWHLAWPMPAYNCVRMGEWDM